MNEISRVVRGLATQKKTKQDAIVAPPARLMVDAGSREIFLPKAGDLSSWDLPYAFPSLSTRFFFILVRLSGIVPVFCSSRGFVSSSLFVL